jgi:hypothetical protein
VPAKPPHRPIGLPDRTVAELLDWPYTFTQLALLTPSKFIREARDRGVWLTDDQLEGLHRARLLIPFARVQRDGREIAAAARSQDPWLHEIAHADTTSRDALQDVAAVGRLCDPRLEGFTARRRLKRPLGELTYNSSEYLYSHHQLIALPYLRQVLPNAQWPTAGEVMQFDIVQPWLGNFRAIASRRHSLVVALTALEPVYWPRIMGRISLPITEEFPLYVRWLSKLTSPTLPRWLGVDGDWLKAHASELLAEADRIDPLGDWLDVVRQAEPDHWRRLKGEARSAIDLRLAAEVLLGLYEHLVRARRAKALPAPQRRFRGEFDNRLKPQAGLDRVLTRFGLSPHPSLVLVVEGDTEMLIMPRVMDLFKVRRDEDFIALQNAASVDRDLSPLIAYVAPRVEAEETGRYLRLVRPPTRMLFVADAEGRIATTELREKRRQQWVKRLLETLPAEQRTPAVRKALDTLVYIEVWKRNGLSFEFAHFTDRELALASLRIDPKPDRLTLDRRIEIVGRLRQRRGNLNELLDVASKVDLADELWPILEHKIARARTRDTHLRIPIVRALDRAITLAEDVRRSNVVIPLGPGT